MITFKRFFAGLAILLLIGGIWVAYEMTNYPSVLRSERTSPPAILIDHVNIISMADGQPDIESERAILIAGNKIQTIATAGTIAPPKGALIIDGKGKTLLPGLIDAHVHIWDEAELAAYLAHGITGVRNMSGMPFHLPLAERIASGEILGPDFQTTGPILNSHGANESDIQKIVTTAEEARAAVKEQHDAGYRALKVYSNLTREAFEATLSEARRLDMSVSGHTPEGVRESGMPLERPFSIPFEQVLGRGFVTIEHIESIAWHGLRGRLDPAEMEKLARTIADSGEAVTTTLIAHDNLVRVAASDGAYLDRPGTETISPLVRLFEQSNYDFWSKQKPEDYEGPRAEFYLVATRLLHQQGVPLIAGTDAGIFTNIPGSSMTRELELLVKAGLSHHDALLAATYVSANALGFDKTGVIAPGYRANLMLVSTNPLDDITAVETPAGVMIGGHWLDEEALDNMQAGARETSLVRSLIRAAHMSWSL